MSNIFMTTFLEYFNIPLDSSDIDFLDINLEKDTPVYIDSYYLTQSNNTFCQKSLKTQKVFMQELMDALKNKDDKKNFFHGIKFPQKYKKTLQNFLKSSIFLLINDFSICNIQV